MTTLTPKFEERAEPKKADWRSLVLNPVSAQTNQGTQRAVEMPASAADQLTYEQKHQIPQHGVKNPISSQLPPTRTPGTPRKGP